EKYLTWCPTRSASAKLWCLWMRWNENQVMSDGSAFHGPSSTWQSRIVAQRKRTTYSDYCRKIAIALIDLRAESASVLESGVTLLIRYEGSVVMPQDKRRRWSEARAAPPLIFGTIINSST